MIVAGIAKNLQWSLTEWKSQKIALSTKQRQNKNKIEQIETKHRNQKVRMVLQVAISSFNNWQGQLSLQLNGSFSLLYRVNMKKM